MLKKINHKFIIFILLFSLFSCSSDKTKPKDYFPLKDGSVYIYNDGLSKREVHFYDKKPKYQLFEVKIFSNDSTYLMKDQFICDNNYVYWYGFKSADYGKIYFYPPINLIPQISGQDTIITGSVKENHDSNTDNEVYNLKITYNYLGKENIQVPAGNFEAVHYQYFIRYIGKEPKAALMDISGDWWFAKNVGLVKQSSSEQVLTLSKYYIP